MTRGAGLTSAAGERRTGVSRVGIEVLLRVLGEVLHVRCLICRRRGGDRGAQFGDVAVGRPVDEHRPDLGVHEMVGTSRADRRQPRRVDAN